MKNKITILVLFLFCTAISAQQPSRISDDSEKKEDAVSATSSESNTTQARPKPTANPRSDFTNRLRFGGNFSLGFGSYTYINLSPRVHYLVQDNLGVGTGFSYYYWKDNRELPPNTNNFKTSGNTWGLNFFSWYNPIGPIVLQAEYEPLNFEVYKGYFDDQATGIRTYVYGREWVHAMFLGGGIRQQSGRANIFIMMLYDVLYDANRSFYSSPWQLRMGVGF